MIKYFYGKEKSILVRLNTDDNSLIELDCIEEIDAEEVEEKPKRKYKPRKKKPEDPKIDDDYLSADGDIVSPGKIKLIKLRQEQGKNSKEICDEMNLSLGTVNDIMSKV